MGEIAAKDIVNLALEKSNTDIHNAIISLIFTTGLNKEVVRNLTINDLIQAAGMSFEEGEPHTIDKLIHKDGKDLFLCWTFEKESKYQVIFSTPATSQYMIKYLKYNSRFYDLDNFDDLFKIKSGKNASFDQIRDNYISDVFNKKKKSLLEYKDVESSLTFSPLSFQKHFNNVCNEYLELDSASDKKELIDLFVGEANEDNKFYEQFEKDMGPILNYYKQLLPYLEVKYFDVTKYIDNPPIKEGYSDSDIWTIVKNYFYKLSIKHNSCPDYDNILKWTNIAFDIAKQDNTQSIFEETDEYFDKLYKKTYLRVFFEDIDINIVLREEFDYVDAAVEVGDILGEHGFFEKFGVDISEFKSIFMDIIECSYCSKIDTNIVISAIESAYYLNDNLKLVEENIL